MRAIETRTIRDSRTFVALCRDLLAQGFQVRFRASGASMQPNLADGDAITVAPSSSADLQRGDVLLTDGLEGLKVHRLVQHDEADGAFITRGDCGQENDLPVTAPVGRVVSRQRHGRATSTSGRIPRLAAKLNSAAHRVRLALRHRTRRLHSYLFPAAFLLALTSFSSVPPAAAANADLAITSSASPSTVAAGGNITYTIVVTNNGPSGAAKPSWTLTTPTYTTFTSVSNPGGGWSCATPAVGAAGTITCTDSATQAVGSGPAATFTLVLTEIAATGPGNATITTTATVSSSTTTDPTSGNNSASSAVTIAATTLSIVETPTPTTVNAGSNISYAVTVTDTGATAAATPAWTQTLPANTTFTSIAKPAAWNCATPAVGAAGTVTCTDTGNLANASTASFTLVVTVAAATVGNTSYPRLRYCKFHQRHERHEFEHRHRFRGRSFHRRNSRTHHRQRQDRIFLRHHGDQQRPFSGGAAVLDAGHSGQHHLYFDRQAWHLELHHASGGSRGLGHLHGHRKFS